MTFERKSGIIRWNVGVRERNNMEKVDVNWKELCEKNPNWVEGQKEYNARLEQIKLWEKRRKAKLFRKQRKQSKKR